MPEEEINECPICGAEVGEDAEECPECGEPLKEGEEKEKAIDRLTEISGLGKSRAMKLYEEGFKTPESIVEGGMKGLAGIEQIGVRTARKIIDEAEKFIEEESQDKEVEEIEEEVEEDVEEVEMDEETGAVEEVKEEIKEEDIEEFERTKEPEESKGLKGEIEDEGVEEAERTEEAEEIEEEVEKEYVESITEDLKNIVEEDKKEELKEGPQRVIIGEKIRENLGDLIPLLSSFLIPVILLVLVVSDFVAFQLDISSIYPVKSLYYFTPLPYIVSSEIVPLTLSLVLVAGLFITTWVGYDFNSVRRLRIDKNMIFFSAILSVIISVSLLIHISSSHVYSGIAFTYLLLVLSLYLLITQLILLWKRETIFPRIEEKKLCEKCSGIIDLDIEECPRCSLKMSVLEEKIQEEEYESVWYSVWSSIRNKLQKAQTVSKDDTISGEEEEELEAEEVEEEVVTEPEEEIPEWEEEVEEEESFFERVSGIGDSIRDGLSSGISFFQNRLGGGSKAETEEIALEEEEEISEAEEIEEEEVIEPEEEISEAEEIEEEEVIEPEEEISEAEEIEEEVIEPEEEISEYEEEAEPKEEEGILKSVSGIGGSIQDSFSSLGTFFQSKLGRGSKAETEEIALEEEEEISEAEEIEEEEVIEPEEEISEAEEIEEEVIEPEEEISEYEEEMPEPKEEEGILKSVSEIAGSIQDSFSSLGSFFQNKLGRGSKAETEEISLEEEEESEEKFEEEEEIEEEGICPTCGSVIPSDSEECPECGEELEPTEEELEEETKGMDTGTSLHELEKVEEHKVEMDMESSLDELEKALEEVEEDSEQIAFVCPICDAEFKEDVDECPECGTVFVEEEEEEGIVEETLGGEEKDRSKS